MNRIRRLATLSPGERRLRLEAALETVRAAVLVFSLPARWVTGRLGSHHEESAAATDTESAGVADLVSRAVHSAAHHVPGKNACLVRGVVAARMLSRRRLPWTLYLGMSRGDEDQLKAHAWVRCGEVVVTGGEVMEEFSVVARFSER